MRLVFREAICADLGAVLELLADDFLGAQRVSREVGRYEAAFRRMQAEGNNHLIVAEASGRIVGTYQITCISGLSLGAARRAQVESVRVASDLRRQGIGRQMFADIETRSRAEGCALIQLTMNATRTASAKFYCSLGFTPSHIGYKREL